MNLTFTVDGTESPAQIERITGALLWFCGQTSVETWKPHPDEARRTEIADAAAATTSPQPSTGAPPITDGAQYPIVVNNVAVDKNGVPWDERIHSGGAPDKRMNQDGTWKKKKGVDEATTATITAELKAFVDSQGNSAPPPPPPATPADSAPPPPPPATPADSAPPPPPPTAAPTSNAGPEERRNFGMHVAWVSAQQNAGKLTADEVNAVLQGEGLVNDQGAGQITKLITEQAKIPVVYDQLIALIAMKGG